jgi:hypothetical protein
MRARREHNARMEQAYITAIIPLMKKPPKLQSLLVPDVATTRRRQTAEEAKAAMRQIFESRKRKK